ncbi:MAG: response regulator transcription factor [Clostridia bacterium]|nr:response regulator transcription factor [Clostridia bacterium]
MSANEKKKILIVEDENNIAQLLAVNLMLGGYDYDIAYDGEAGLEKALTGQFDLILLDLMLPKLNGYEVCSRVREKLNTPIIMVTAREEEKDKILGLDTGADDYVTKPFSIGELMSRIKANIRRSSSETVIKETGSDTHHGDVIRVRDLSIDLGKYDVTLSGEPVSLSKQEYELISFLAKNLGQPYTREQLLEKVWGYEGFLGDIRAVDVTVSRLRAKIERDPSNPEYLLTKRGIGYYLK